MLGLLTAAVIGVGSIAYAPVAANAMQTVCDGYTKIGSKGLSLPGSTGEVIRLWWYKNSSTGEWCAYTELRGIYYDTASGYHIGVTLKNSAGQNLVVPDDKNYFKYAGPVKARGVSYAEGWVYWGGVRKPVDSR
ncbi:hypothetical protein [Dactylosporangium sp. CS-033363]|uniref:hypothetical protein n=1 Tax=Dactylosporangium sp. CS-033363 TaxID=3239935 RepID=UPI003D92F8DA